MALGRSDVGLIFLRPVLALLLVLRSLLKVFTFQGTAVADVNRAFVVLVAVVDGT